MKLLMLFFLVFTISFSSGSALSGNTVRNSVHLMSNASLTDEQISFTAKNFPVVLLGQWEKTLAKAADLKYYNPYVIVLGYLNSSHLIPESPRYKEASFNEDLFAHNDLNQRIMNLSFNTYLMDIQNPLWSDKLVDWSFEMPKEIDGVFLDAANPILDAAVYSALPSGYNSEDYPQNMMDLFYKVSTETNGYVLMNGIKEGLEYEGYLKNLDGGVLEGFIFYRNDQRILTDRIYNHLSAMIEARKQGKYIIVAPKSYKEDSDRRIFALASYLLCASNYSFYTFTDLNLEFTGELQYYPEYKFNIGSPIHDPDRVEDLLDPQTNLLVRYYKKGMVIVNPWDFELEISLPQRYKKVNLQGGGEVLEDGTPSGSISYKSVGNHLIVPARSAAILAQDNG